MRTKGHALGGPVAKQTPSDCPSRSHCDAGWMELCAAPGVSVRRGIWVKSCRLRRWSDTSGAPPTSDQVDAFGRRAVRATYRHWLQPYKLTGGSTLLYRSRHFAPNRQRASRPVRPGPLLGSPSHCRSAPIGRVWPGPARDIGCEQKEFVRSRTQTWAARS
jgi:hypothetical protein